MSATTEKVRELLGTRLTELDEEKGRVERAIEALGSSKNESAPAPTPRRRRRNRVGGTRADQVVKLIKETPGMSVSDIAKAMKIEPNYLYRVLKDLTLKGVVNRGDGRRYSLAG